MSPCAQQYLMSPGPGSPLCMAAHLAVPAAMLKPGSWQPPALSAGFPRQPSAAQQQVLAHRAPSVDGVPCRGGGRGAAPLGLAALWGEPPLRKELSASSGATGAGADGIIPLCRGAEAPSHPPCGALQGMSAASRAGNPMAKAGSRSESPRVADPEHGPQGDRAPDRAPDRQELIFQHVQYFLRTHPAVMEHHSVVKRSASVYELDGHRVGIEWQHASEPGQPGHLVVVDGPLRQPFADYLARNEANAEYDTDAIARTSALHHVPRERRMTFDDKHRKYSRLEAMKVAKEQAKVREKAADYTKEGRDVPDDLVRKYNKALRQRIRPARGREEAGPVRDENSDPLPNARTPREAANPKVAPERACNPPMAAPEQACSPPMAAAVMVHRGISLNGVPTGVPSYLPAQAPTSPYMIRSWSGTSMPTPGLVAPSMIPPALFAVPGVAVQNPLANGAPVASAHVSGQPPLSGIPMAQVARGYRW